jgi:hypothetical protein
MSCRTLSNATALLRAHQDCRATTRGYSDFRYWTRSRRCAGGEICVSVKRSRPPSQPPERKAMIRTPALVAASMSYGVSPIMTRFLGETPLFSIAASTMSGSGLDLLASLAVAFSSMRSSTSAALSKPFSCSSLADVATIALRPSSRTRRTSAREPRSGRRCGT